MGIHDINTLDDGYGLRECFTGTVNTTRDTYPLFDGIFSSLQDPDNSSLSREIEHSPFHLISTPLINTLEHRYMLCVSLPSCRSFWLLFPSPVPLPLVLSSR